MLEALVPGTDLAAFFESVRDAADRVLILDYDGTLAPFTVDRDRAVPYDGVRALLPQLMRLPRASVAIVSGRAVAELVRLLGVAPLPELWGSHGWERLARGHYQRVALDGASERALAAAGAALDALGLTARREDKPVGIAAHWRGEPPQEAGRIAARVTEAWSTLLPGTCLEIHPFDGGLELRPRGRDKGSAVAAILAGRAGAAVAYLGDDLTDEDGFRAVPSGGLRVLVRRDTRPSLADIRIEPPHELLDFLGRWREACARATAGA